VFQYPPEALDALATAYRQVAPDSPVNLQSLKQALDAYQTLFVKIANGIRQAGAFSEPEQWQLAWERTYTRNEWLDQLPTHGRLNLLPPDKLATVLQSVGAAIDAMGASPTVIGDF
jgi:DNA-directed RNA polymerase specialized sigma24 family protein